MLMAWGLQEANKDGISSSLISAHEKEGFYEQFDFIESGRANVGRLKELKGGAIMFREAK